MAKPIDQQTEIIEAIAKHLGVATADIDPNASLFDDLGLGPIELSDLISFLANQFDIVFRPAEVESLETVEDLLALVEDSLLE